MNESSARQPAPGKGVTQEDWIELGYLFRDSRDKAEGMSQRQHHHQQQHIAATRIQEQPKKSMSEKEEKERFLMFTRVLMKYLEQRDTEMHARAKQVIKECYERNKAGDAAYKSLTQSMKTRLRASVGETYWKKAHDYLAHFFKQKQLQQQGPGASTGGVPRSTVSSASTRPPPKKTPASKPPLEKKEEVVAALKPNTNPSQKKREADKLLQRTVSELDDGAKKRMKLQGVKKDAHQLFQKDSECPICLEILVKSVSIHPCGHSFCGECAETHLKSTSSTAASADASSKKTECPTCKSKICGFNRSRALDTMIWAAALTGTFESGDAMNYMMRMEQVGERVATEEEKECILRRTGNN